MLAVSSGAAPAACVQHGGSAQAIITVLDKQSCACCWPACSLHKHADLSMAMAAVAAAGTLQVKVLLNMAAVCLALEDWGAAAQHCSSVLALEPQNAPALLRRAKAMARRREFEVGAKNAKQMGVWVTC